MRILIVDDEPAVSYCLNRMAESRGYTDIDIAASGEEALVQTVRKEYDLITLDLQMPGSLNGLEILRLLRSRCPHTIIAVLSGFIPDEIYSEEANCVDVMLSKPVDVDVFIRLLDYTEQIALSRRSIGELGDVFVEAG